MRRACWLLLFGVGLTHAQDKLATKRLPSGSKLHTNLLALKEPPVAWKWDAEMRRARPPLSYQLADEIMRLAESDHQPSRSAVADFTDELAIALIGKSMTDADALMLEQSINSVLRSTGATFTAATQLRSTLAAVGVDASTLRTVTRRFIAIGEEVRGPDDLPVQ
jgi:hypothetical protein